MIMIAEHGKHAERRSQTLQSLGDGFRLDKLPADHAMNDVVAGEQNQIGLGLER